MAISQRKTGRSPATRSETGSTHLTGSSLRSAGGAIYCDGSSPTIANCVITGNAADLGGGICCDYFSNPAIINCTLTDNTAGCFGGGIYCWFSSPTVTDCTISRNEAVECCGDSVVASYSCIEGGWSGTANIADDPLLTDPDGADDTPGTTDDDIHLLPGSPCAGGGFTQTCQPGDLDYDGEPRVMDGRIEMGADEISGTAGFLYGDLNCDCIANGFDIDHFIQALDDWAGYLADHDGDPYSPCDLWYADVNADGAVNGFDIDAFVLLLGGG
ncbi:MAG: right-handed parallel beta-helix repeat-containing protein [Planctomycetes bacterium]|nr:right-handed parallel beta-helix repeat-containing protein [Planctomycetota bacterium]